MAEDYAGWLDGNGLVAPEALVKARRRRRGALSPAERRQRREAGKAGDKGRAEPDPPGKRMSEARARMVMREADAAWGRGDTYLEHSRRMWLR